MSFDRPSYSRRAAFLGAVALASRGGAAAETSVAPVPAAATTAEAPAVQAPAGPASFADVVDRVKPAVVSVKVKLSDADQVDDEDSDSDAIPGLPDIPKNSPFYHFFRHFGMPDNNDNGNGD